MDKTAICNHSFISCLIYLLTNVAADSCSKCSAYSADLVTVQFVPDSIDLQIHSSKNVSILFSHPLLESTELVFTYARGDSDVTFIQRTEIIHPLENVTLPNGTDSTTITIEGLNAGSVTVSINETSSELANAHHSFVKVTVIHYYGIYIFGIVIGWIYFIAWSISFYPQIIENFRGKSVQGLNFDFVCYNLTGHFSYGVFNVCMYWVDSVQAEYLKLHPLGVNPVQPNDVFFSIHAVAVCLITLIQCFIYESGGQRLSIVCRILLTAFWLFLIISLFVAINHAITWLQYLYFFSYVKLAITIIKYVPQAWMNFRRQSTAGWSIGNILLDFTGGILSMLQMCLIAYNTDDWTSVMGDPTKFGLGLFSVLFDIVFIVQHYVLYRHGTHSYTVIVDENKR